MIPPIVAVDTDGEVSVFLTTEGAEGYHEINDLDEYTYYDGEGRLLRGVAHPKGLNRIVLEDAEETPSHQEALREVLLRAIPRWRGAPTNVSAWGLWDLLRLAEKYAIGA